MLDAAKLILSQNPIDAVKKKLRVNHYVSLLTDFGIPEAEFSEERGGKTLRLKSKDLTAFFWSRMDVVNRYHTYEDGDSSSSFEEVSDDDDSDSCDWIPGSVADVGERSLRGKRKRPTESHDVV